MGLFDGFSKAIKKIVSTEYELNNVVIDTMIVTRSIFEALLFENSRFIYSEYNKLIEQCITAKNNGNEEEQNRIYQISEDYILNTVKRIHYEEDLQYSQIQPIVYLAIGDFAQIIQIIQNIDGQRSQQYFSGFTLQEQTAESLAQNVSQIISRDYAMYLRDYLVNLENLQRYAEYMNNSPSQGSGGSLLTGAMGGAAAFVNPLLGLGLIAKAVYDGYQSDQNEQAKIDKYHSLHEKWADSFYKLPEIQDAVCRNVSDFIGQKISSAFDEFIGALEQYCTEYNFDVNIINNAVYQYRINYGKMPTFNNETEKEAFIKIASEIIRYEKIHPDVLKFYKNALQRLS